MVLHGCSPKCSPGMGTGRLATAITPADGALLSAPGSKGGELQRARVWVYRGHLIDGAFGRALTPAF
jgi:hypothetical protein